MTLAKHLRKKRNHKNIKKNITRKYSEIIKISQEIVKMSKEIIVPRYLMTFLVRSIADSLFAVQSEGGGGIEQENYIKYKH